MISMVVMTAILFSLGGFINAVYATKFDDVAIVPTFVLTPLTYLGGVFYSIKLLPEFWYNLSLLNPLVYMINGFRFGVLGVADVSLLVSYGIIVFAVAALFCWAWYLMEKGIGMRH